MLAENRQLLKGLFPLKVNVGDEVFSFNVTSAVAMDLPWLQVEAENNKDAVLIAGGPSLADCKDELLARYKSGQIFFALNNTAKWLIDRNMIPHYHVMLDARPFNARFIKRNKNTHYLISSQCAPEVFAAAGEVTLWHPNIEGIQSYIGDKEAALIGGGTTVGLQAMSIAYTKGFRRLHLFGYDSSYRSGEGHAYPQPENDGEPLVHVSFAGKQFMCARWMVHQVEEFKEVAKQLVDSCSISVAGEGFLQETFKDMILPKDMACYDFSKAPSSWDFTTWLIIAKANCEGQLKVSFKKENGFRNDGLPDPGKQKMFDNVIRPALKLVDAIEVEGSGREFPYTMRLLTEYDDIPKLIPPKDYLEDVDRRLKGDKPVVISLREASHWEHRNSNLEAWLQFARSIDERVIFVRDTEKAGDPLGFEISERASCDVLYRAALYARAKIVMGISNGPMQLAIFSKTPYLIFGQLVENYNCGTPDWWEKAIGVKVGNQFKWATPKQRLTWCTDSYENISHHFNLIQIGE